MSFTDREYDMALDLLVQMGEALGSEEPCDLCFKEKREWCAEHCDKKNSKCPDKECFREYFFLKLQEELAEILTNETKKLAKEITEDGFEFI